MGKDTTHLGDAPERVNHPSLRKKRGETRHASEAALSATKVNKGEQAGEPPKALLKKTQKKY